MSINLLVVPQVIPYEEYLEHLASASASSEATVRLFASLSLARLHLDISSWAAAAEALVMPGRMGVRCARACSATMLVTADEWKARVWRAIEEIPRDLQPLGGQDPPPPRGGAAGSTNWPDATGLAPDTAPTTSA